MNAPIPMPARRNRRGFTLTEMLVTLMIVGFLIAGTISAMLYIMRSETRLSLHAQMNTEAQRALTLIRNAARLTSFDDMVFYPSNAAPTAISFPVPNLASPALSADGRLAWEETFVIHVWPPDDPAELRFTRFGERNNGLSETQRYDDLRSVVTNGNGLAAQGDADPSTRTLAQLASGFTMQTEGRLYDFYSAEEKRDTSATFGGVRIQPGTNTIRFTAIDQHDDSSGYGLRLDLLRLSPAGLPLEAEVLGVTAQSGATPSIEEAVSSNWSDRRYRQFPGTAAGHFLELEFFNDTWHETLFLGSGNDLSNAVTYVHDTPGSVGTRLLPAGQELTWSATLQTSINGEGMTSNLLMGAAVRVVLRGSTAINGGAQILAPGDGCRVTFRATDQLDWLSGLYITDAFISEAASHYDPGMDIDPTTTQRLRFGSPGSPRNWAWLPSGSFAQSVPTAFPINPIKSYVVSYRLYGPWYSYQFGVPMAWPISTNRYDSFYIPGTNTPTVADTTTGQWSSRGDVIPYSAVLGVEEVQSTYVSNAVFTSRIMDTRLSSPDYHDVNWTGTTPSGTAIQMQMRTFNQPDASDAPGWQTVATPGDVPTAAGNGRYVQIRSTLTANTIYDTAPELHHFTLRWLGEQAFIDIGGIFGKYPGGGVMDVAVNDEAPAASLRLNIALSGTPFAGSPLTWALGMEIAPRNQ